MSSMEEMEAELASLLEQADPSASTKRYLISRPQTLPADVQPLGVEQLRNILQLVTNVTLLEQIGTDQATVLVVEMSPERMSFLQKSFGQKIVIEEDAPLTLVDEIGTAAVARQLDALAETITTLETEGGAILKQLRQQITTLQQSIKKPD